ncbi:HD domain-containing protein [Ruminococcus sp. YE71]|uniref:HD-GYP domain-containing protein n=1 Tax=unclassified Ruminococcus TaxID=2608920 RepID=UPI000890C696|nr:MULTISPECIES: HD-GYP domain-containing protein [unclassified Ruminococcus]SDA14649.1 HD domain-containing protein [Ruminococcus sp. YE78]SFW21285.1 HD domain-containing protein [Ruminococcus sp. YE71]
MIIDAENAIIWISGLINMLIPALIFLFLTDIVFLSKYNASKDKRSKWERRKKLLKLIPVSPIGLFLILVLMLVIFQTIIGSVMSHLNIIEYQSEFTIIPLLTEKGIVIDADTSNGGAAADALLILLVISFILAVPITMLVIRRYCKIIGCSRNLGVFIYMAVLFMYVTSTLITLPINDVNPTVSNLISMGSFIIMLIIFYLPSKDRIELMRQKENSGLLVQINTLPIINFIILLILLAFEFMLDKNGYLDMAYYIIILAFALLLYAASQLSYNILLRHIEESNEILALSEETIKSQEQVTLAFAEITEAKSGQTGKHVKRVSEYSRVIAEGMDLPPSMVNNIRIASMMHDIGKLLIPPEVLEKPGRLTDEEFTIMKEHVVIGENLLCNAPGEIMHMACVIAHQHHEWWDGSGYLGIKGEDIEVPARICAVADVYDALTSVRSYKKAWTAEEAFEIITKEAGTHFEPQVVWAFAKHFDEIKKVQELYKDENANYQH